MTGKGFVTPKDIEDASKKAIPLMIQIIKGNWDAAHAELNKLRGTQYSECVDLSCLPEETRLSLPLIEIGLSVKTCNGLEKDGITTVRHLLSETPHSLIERRNVGVSTLQSIYECLGKIGFHQ
tara:strand:+ start:2626 stop:2994 length:369 start_codon:yes stop_codon:yes gene_type:complete